MTTGPILYESTGEPSDRPAPKRRFPGRELAVALGVAVAVAAAGLPVGLLWSAVAPHAPLVMTPYGPTTVDAEPEQFVADDGWYVSLTLALGVLVAVAVWALLRRYRGPLMLAGLVVGGVASGVLAAWLGHRIGLAHYLDLRANAPVGTRFARPVDVRSKYVGLWFHALPRVQGAVLIEAITAGSVYALLAAFHATPDLDAQVDAQVDVQFGANGTASSDSGTGTALT